MNKNTTPALKALAYARGNVVCDCTVSYFEPGTPNLPVYYVTCADCVPAPRTLPVWVAPVLAIGVPVSVFLAALIHTI